MSEIQPNDHCRQCLSFQQPSTCLLDKKDPETCRELITYLERCPQCQKEFIGKREYLTGARVEFECKDCDVRWSLLYPDGPIGNLR